MTGAAVFQFLIGWLQTFSSYSSGSNRESFNSLQVGYKRSLSDAETLFVEIVSIPYRLATNGKKPVIMTGAAVFQFLIGWLQTFSSYSSGSNRESFNSLQVGYKLITQLISNGLLKQRFNSLQVGYKPHPLSCIAWAVRVSIPYRLATNTFRHLTTYQMKKFQFLIGWLQTDEAEALLNDQ